MWIKPALKLFAWLAAGIGGALALGYLALVIVNLNDRPPSPEALAYSREQARRPVLPDADNAYVFLLGFEAARNADPAREGASRLAWVRQQSAAPYFDHRGDPLSASNGPERDFSEPVRGLSRACQKGGVDCLLALKASPDALDSWLAEGRWLQDRYQRLIAYRQWQEPRPWDLMAPIAGYATAGEGQKLYLASALQLARQGHITTARERLEADAYFWLMALGNADTLISKLLAASSLMRNMAWTNLAARDIPPPQMLEIVPPSLRQPLSRQACSMRTTMAGEWAAADRMVRKMDSSWQELELLQLDRGQVWRERAVSLLQRPLWQKQDTSNDMARRNMALGTTFDTECARFGAALARWRLQAAAGPDNAGGFRAYNPVYYLTAYPASDLGQYAARMGDLEALRRALLAAVTLRQAGTLPTEVNAALAAAPLRDPVTGGPLLWEAESGSITFRSLGDYKREWYRIPY